MRKIFVFLVSALVVMGCSSDAEETARLEVRLTDSPGDYEEVNIDIQGVEIHSEEGEQNSGWQTLDVEKGVYDILKLTNGQDTLLGIINLPAGRLSQIRLILGDENSVKIDGETYELKTPSGQQSGLKLNIQSDIEVGLTYRILLDFDAARSVVKRGNGSYNLKPVIRSIVAAQSGAIKGTVTPVESLPAVFAIQGTDTVATAYTDATGGFVLGGLPSGSYKVSFDAKEGFTDVVKQNVSVTIGSVTNVGTVDLE